MKGNALGVNGSSASRLEEASSREIHQTHQIHPPMPHRHNHRTLPSRWVVLPCLLAVGAFVFSSPVVRAEGAAPQRETSIVSAVRSAEAAVVDICGEKSVGSAGASGRIDSSRRVNGMGTGVVIDPRGYIITNHHVVEGVRRIQVTTHDGATYIARLIQRDEETDLAIIKIDVDEPLPVIKIGRSDDLMVAEPVVAIGNAFGYNHTVTVGVIGALHRAVQVSDAQDYDDLIQTDAAINPGNSGGPLLNVEGQMIGINVAVRAGAQGIGFAIPVDRVIAVAERLLAACNVPGGLQGVTFQARGDDPAAGLVVEAVEADSAGSRSGLQAGDIMTAVGQFTIERKLDVHRALLDLEAGDNVAISVQRDGEPLTLELTLPFAPIAKAASPSVHGTPAWEFFGLDLTPLADEEFRRRFQTQYRGGLVINAIRPNSPAATQGIVPGDVLVGMHLWETVSLDNVGWFINRPDIAQLSPLKFYILRGEETLYGYMPLTARTASKESRE